MTWVDGPNWWPLVAILVVVGGMVAGLAVVERRERDPYKRYWDRMARADRDLQRDLKKQRWAR